MCTRFTLKSPVDLLQRLYGFGEEMELTPRYNIAPSQPALTLFADAGGITHARMMNWGMVDNAIPTPIVNVRSETAESNPLFRESASQRRALVIADGFYEWRGEGASKQPYYFEFPDHRPFAMAAIFDQDRRFALLTIDANESVQPIHDRMSLLVPRDEVGSWLSGEQPVAKAIPTGKRAKLHRRAVDPAVNDARREGKELLDPPRQQRLF